MNVYSSSNTQEKFTKAFGRNELKVSSPRVGPRLFSSPLHL